MSKEELLDDFCRRTGQELDPDYRKQWLAQPMQAFMAKLVEWNGWQECSGRIDYVGSR